jgi:hypothetical protein
MGTTVKTLFQSFIEVPEGKFPSEYYTPRFIRAFIFWNFGYAIGLFFHALFIVLFTLMGITILALFNIGSVIFWTAAVFLHRRGYFWQAYCLVTIELLISAKLFRHYIRNMLLHQVWKSLMEEKYVPRQWSKFAYAL